MRGGDEGRVEERDGMGKWRREAGRAGKEETRRGGEGMKVEWRKGMEWERI